MNFKVFIKAVFFNEMEQIRRTFSTEGINIHTKARPIVCYYQISLNPIRLKENYCSQTNIVRYLISHKAYVGHMLLKIKISKMYLFNNIMEIKLFVQCAQQIYSRGQPISFL